MRRAATLLPLAGAALVLTGAAPLEEQAMLDAFDEALAAMAYAAAGLCLFSIVWAGFVLMAEGSEERGAGPGQDRGDAGRRGAGPGPLGQGRGLGPAQRHRPHSLAQGDTE